MAHPHVLSTLFPHVDHAGAGALRAWYGLGILVVVALGATGLIWLAVPAAVAFLPVLYLGYLQRAQLYRQEPVRVLAGTVGAGLVLGLVVTPISIQVLRVGPAAGAGLGGLLMATVAIPIIQELLKPVVTLHLRPRFPQTMDGLVFGVAAGLGFAAGESVINLWATVASTAFRVDGQGWLYSLVSIGVLVPLLQGTCTGVLAAAVWRFRRGRGGVFEKAGLPVALLGHVAFVLGGQLLVDNDVDTLVVLGWQALMVAAVVVFARYLLHAALLDEAAELGLRETECVNCHRRGEAAGFCPGCGHGNGDRGSIGG